MDNSRPVLNHMERVDNINKIHINRSHSIVKTFVEVYNKEYLFNKELVFVEYTGKYFVYSDNEWVRMDDDMSFNNQFYHFNTINDFISWDRDIYKKLVDDTMDEVIVNIIEPCRVKTCKIEYNYNL